MSDFKSKFPNQAPIRAKVGEYEKDGKTKARYQTVGRAFATPNRHHMILRVDSEPRDWDGAYYVDFDEDNGRQVDPAKIS